MIKASIYTSLSFCFIGITISMIVGDFNRPGFNPAVMIAISGTMSVIMLSVSWVLWRSRNISKEINKPKDKTNNKPLHLAKVVFASYGVALALTILSVVAGLWLFGFEVTESVLLDNMGVVLLSLTAISAPVVYRYLR